MTILIKNFLKIKKINVTIFVENRKVSEIGTAKRNLRKHDN